ncbi:hypothetical protein ACFP2T_37535 [Plantactinospora solaniradicis]|uniref:Uncharacterized protein n=1 Tax=Plantactinospora solaniradicis TaxID=1723736 RepID=A0ABW1KL37_9ACTN
MALYVEVPITVSQMEAWLSTDEPPRSTGNNTVRRRWSEFAEAVEQLGRHLWDEATDRSRPNWPPGWLAFVIGGIVLLLVGYVVIPLLAASVGAIAGWTDDGIDWMAAEGFIAVVADPVRAYINERSLTLPINADVLWLAWLVSGAALLILAFAGTIGARIGWVVFGLGTAGMVWSETARPGEWLAVGVTTMWWSALGTLAYRRRPRHPSVVVVPQGSAPPAVDGDTQDATEDRATTDRVPS